MGGRRPTQTDVAVGQRIRAFREDAKLTQTELADQIGVAYQQLQKYEKGTNRVGAGRLARIAHALDVPITALFNGVARPADKQGKAAIARFAELGAVPAARKLLQAFSQISDPVLQTEIINLIRALNAVGNRK